MKIHKNIVQGTEEWERIRYGKIGGTRSKFLLKPTDTIIYELLAEHTEPYAPDYDSYESADMIRGHELEPHARKSLEDLTGIEFLEAGWIEGENSFIGISPDGYSACGKFMCELKCLGAKKHNEIVMKDGIHEDYIFQCVHYFTVNPDLETLFFAAYRPEHLYKPLVMRKLERHSEVNVGTKSKPIIITVQTATGWALDEALNLKAKLDTVINEMKF